MGLRRLVLTLEVTSVEEDIATHVLRSTSRYRLLALQVVLRFSHQRLFHRMLPMLIPILVGWTVLRLTGLRVLVLAFQVSELVHDVGVSFWETIRQRVAVMLVRILHSRIIQMLELFLLR